MSSKRESSSFEESPLLTNKGMNSSTVNPSKLDQARFTEIRDMESESSPIRIIIYVVIVIVIGVGAALLVKNLVANNQQKNDDSLSTKSSSSSSSSSVLSLSSSSSSDLSSSSVSSSLSSSSSSLSSSSSSSSSLISSSSSSSVASGEIPAAPHFDNDYSQNRQYVVNSMTGNKVAQNIYFFDVYGGGIFEFSWAQKNSIGDSTVPNATAYYDTSVTDKTILIVEISNLTKEVFTANGVTGRSAEEIKNQTKVNPAGTNFNRIDLVSFTNGTAKYKIELQKKSDFKLWVDKTGDNSTGTISINVKNN